MHDSNAVAALTRYPPSGCIPTASNDGCQDVHACVHRCVRACMHACVRACLSACERVFKAPLSMRAHMRNAIAHMLPWQSQKRCQALLTSHPRQDHTAGPSDLITSSAGPRSTNALYAGAQVHAWCVCIRVPAPLRAEVDVG